MNYSKTPPTENGFYFFRESGSDEPTIAEIHHDPNQTDCPPEELFTAHLIADSETHLVCNLEGEWAGPIPIPGPRSGT